MHIGIKEPSESRLFADPSVAGFHANLAWANLEKVSEILNSVVATQQSGNQDFFDAVVFGVWASNQVLRNKVPTEATLYHALRQHYITGKIDSNVEAEIVKWSELCDAFERLPQNKI